MTIMKAGNHKIMMIFPLRRALRQLEVASSKRNFISKDNLETLDFAELTSTATISKQSFMPLVSVTIKDESTLSFSRPRMARPKNLGWGGYFRNNY